MNGLSAVLDDLHTLGYESVDRVEGYEGEASGEVPLPEDRREPATGWRRYLPRVYDGGDPDLVPDDLREVVESHGWTVQAMGRDDETVLVYVSENGV
jgi:hypothetical protein